MRNQDYMTRNQAADYLIRSVDTVDRMTITGSVPKVGKVRCHVTTINNRRSVYILSQDVYAILPKLEAK